MEPISLKKVTAVVSICTMGAFFVNANEPVALKASPELKDSVKKVTQKVTQKLSQFDQLVKKYDVDNNGELSQTEIKVSKNTDLIAAFTQIDANADAGISAKEYQQYVKAVSTK